ncbi:MAG TPA: hypothetical protein VN032_05440 [Thermoanaerobaculia bacterium]|jgi:hypothetical protein|nr:hypothetical protein [Thermoanaerobaculia bacterium]
MNPSAFRSARCRAALVLVLAAVSLAAAAETRDPRSNYDRDFSRTLAYKPGTRLDIEHSQGSLRIGTHALPEVRIKARITVSSSDADGAQKFGEGITITVEDTGSAIFVRTKYPEKQWHFIGNGSVSYSVDIDITMPETMALSARNRFGNTDVVNLKAPAVLVGANGQLSLSDGRGRQRLENSFGSITVNRNAGEVEISGSNGAVVATDVEGAVSIRNRFGAVQVKKAKGAVTVNTSNGDVVVEEVTGTASLTGSFGRIDVRDVGGAVEVRNSNGSVRVRDVKSSANLKTSFGEVDASGIPGDATVVDDNGSVLLANVGGRVDARGSFGKISVTQARKDVRVVGNNSAVTLSDVSGAASVSTSFGLVEATRIEGDLTVDNSNGAVRATAVKGGAKVTTSFAPVALDGIAGRVDVDNQNGSIEVRGLPGAGKCFPVTLKGSFAPIRLYVSEGTGYDVSARTSFGKVSSQVPLTISGSISTDALSGKIGDGKCPLSLEDSNGNIEILRGK